LLENCPSKSNGKLSINESLSRVLGVWPITVAAHELVSLDRTLGSWVRILLKAWMFVCVYSVFVCRLRPCDGLITRPRSPADCLRNWSETKRFTVALPSKLRAIGKRERLGVWLLDWIYCTYTLTSQLQVVQRYRWSTQFTVHRHTHTLGFSVFTSRILAKDFNTVVIPVSLYLQHTWSLLCTAALLQLFAVSSRSYSTAVSRDCLNYYSSWPGILVI
jgi:hypothetical protein